MKRKFLSLILIILLLSQLLIPAYATETVVTKAQVCAAYWQDGMLYTFAHFDGEDPASQEVSLLINNQQLTAAYPVSAADAEATVHYMLLVDTSTSMAGYRSKIISFAQELMQTQQNVKISVAKFDSQFSVVDTELTSWSDVKASLQSLTFYRDGSDINGSTAAAINHLGADGYPAGEMTNLVAITDGEPWYSNDAELEAQREDHANQTLSAMMQAYPEIVVHSLSFRQWNEHVYETLSQGKGLHTVGGSAAAAGTALADYTDALYTVFTSAPGTVGNAQLIGTLTLCVGNSFISYGNVRNAGVAPTIDVDIAQEDIPEESTVPEESTESGETEAPEPTEVPEAPLPADGSSTDADDMPTETTEATVTTETTESAEPVESVETEPSASEEAPPTTIPPPLDGLDGNPNIKKNTIIRAVAIVVVLVLILIVVILVLKKKRGHKDSVRMRFEVVSGGNLHTKDVYHLTHEIVIGSDKHCDIVIPGNSGATDARIFKQGQLIYIEDLGSADGTALNGMRIFSSNRLRSGDEITIGTITLRVLF